MKRKLFLMSNDPLNKFITCILFAVLLITLRDIKGVAIASFLIFSYSYLGSRFSLKTYVKIVSLLLIGSLFIIVFQSLFQTSDVFYWNSVRISMYGFFLGVSIALRSFGYVAIMMSFAKTTTASGIEKMLIKIRFPERIAYLVVISALLMGIFVNDLSSFFENSRLQKYRFTLPNLKRFVLFFLSYQLQRVNDLHIALETRGFSKNDVATKIEAFRFSLWGTLVNIFVIALFYVRFNFWEAM